MDLSILIPTYNEEENVLEIIKEIKHILNQFLIKYEIIVMDGQSKDNTRENAKKAGAKVFLRSSTDFKTFLTEGISKTKGRYIITMDSDFSNPPSYIHDLWESRDKGDIIVCSKWVKGGRADMSLVKKMISQLFNFMYRTILSIKVYDLNCNYRLYNRIVLEKMKLTGDSFTILPEIIFHASRLGYKIKEIPFFCAKRSHGKSKLNLITQSKLYVKTLLILWKMKTIKSHTTSQL